jgi:hypothetical protein
MRYMYVIVDYVCEQQTKVHKRQFVFFFFYLGIKPFGLFPVGINLEV